MPEHDKLYVVGVLSAGIPDVNPNGDISRCYPGEREVYVSVLSQIDWIRNVTAGDLCASGRSKANGKYTFVIGAGLLVGLIALISFLLFLSHKNRQDFKRSALGSVLEP